jgi:hypothetical protein
MFGRHVSIHSKPNTRAEFTQTIENETFPSLRLLRIGEFRKADRLR